MLDRLLNRLGYRTGNMESFGAKKDFADSTVEYLQVGCGWGGAVGQLLPLLTYNKKRLFSFKEQEENY